MVGSIKLSFFKIFLSVSLFLLTFSSFGVNNLERAKATISVEEKLGNTVSLNVSFVDEDEKLVKIRDYFANNTKPIILTPVYYSCPHLCNYIFEGLTKAVSKESKYRLGRDYKILSISMNHEDGAEQAKFKKEEYFKKITYFADESKKKKREIERGWSLLTGAKNEIKTFYNSVGFRYNKEKGEYAHTASLIFLTPQGKVARYLYGIRFQKNDFRLAILEASQGKVSSFVDQVFFYCFRYDPDKRVYNLIAWRVMTAGGLLVVVLLSSLLAILWVREYRKKQV